MLTLVKLLHDVLERQAVRRMEAGRLTDAQIENVGAALFAQAEEILRLQRQFGFSDKDLSLALGVPHGDAVKGIAMPSAQSMTHSVESTNLADLLERILDKGVVVAGDISIKLVEVELLTIQLRLVICSVDKARELGLDWWNHNGRPERLAPGAKRDAGGDG